MTNDVNFNIYTKGDQTIGVRPPLSITTYSRYVAMNEPKIQNSSKKVKPKLTQERLKKYLLYDPETGIFTRVRTGKGCKKGDIAGHKARHGYVTISVENKPHYASRLAFLWMEGYFPENNVDHINRVRDDDRWENLRHVTQSCNMRNLSIRSTNKSGVAGVHWSKKDRRWVSQISVNSKAESIGVFVNFKEAVQARWEAEVKYGYPNCCTISSAYLYLQGENNG